MMVNSVFAPTPLNTIVKINNSGSSQNLNGDTSPVLDVVYDVNLTANCTFTLSATANGRLQTIILILRQDGTGGRVPSLPSGIIWSNAYPPLLNTFTGFVDVLQLSTTDGITWFGVPITLSAATGSLTVIPFTTPTFSGGQLAVSGTYIGVTPTNLDYNVDATIWITLSAGSASITNGVFSFSITAPANGSHSIQVRPTNAPGAISPTQTFTILAPVAPTLPVLGVSPGNAQNTLAMGATINGSNVVSFQVYRGLSSGGEGATPIATVTSGIVNGATTATATYLDTGLTNGTTYYYYVTATNGVGTSVHSAEQSATPSVAAGLSHALLIPSNIDGGNAFTNRTTTNDTTTGVLDVQAYVNLSSYTGGANGPIYVVSRYEVTGNSAWSCIIGSDGAMDMFVFDNGSNFSAVGSGQAITAVITPSTTLGVYLRWALNKSTTSFTTGINVGGSPYVAAAGSFAAFVSPDGSTWTQCGTTTTGLPQTGIAVLGNTGPYPSIGNFQLLSASTVPASYKIYRVTVRDRNGILFNPDFTTLATGATSITDTAPTPNLFSVNNCTIT